MVSMSEAHVQSQSRLAHTRLFVLLFFNFICIHFSSVGESVELQLYTARIYFSFFFPNLVSTVG